MSTSDKVADLIRETAEALGGRIMSEEFRERAQAAAPTPADMTARQRGDIIHESLVSACKAVALGLDTGTLAVGGLFFVAVGGGNLATFPALPSIDAKTMRRMLRLAVKAYAPDFIGGCLRVDMHGIKPAVELKCVGCGASHEPRFAIVTSFRGADGDTYSRTDFLDASARHRMGTETPCGDDPYLIGSIGGIYSDDEPMNEETE